MELEIFSFLSSTALFAENAALRFMYVRGNLYWHISYCSDFGGSLLSGEGLFSNTSTFRKMKMHNTQQLAFRNRCHSGFIELKSHLVRLLLPSYPCFSVVHSSTVLNLLLCIAGRLCYQTLPKTLPGVKRETGNSLSCPCFESGNSCLQYMHLSHQHLESRDTFLSQGFVYKCA